MRFLRLILPFIVFVLSAFSLKATHIVGGEIGYECLGDNQYKITLTVFRDCYYGIPLFDDPASIGFFQKDSISATYELLIPFSTTDTLDYSLEDPCLTFPPDVCVEVTRYVDTIYLPLDSNGYTIVYQRCCRNETILNIQDPLFTGASFVTQMTGASMIACNSSPTFNNWPPLALCANKPFVLDHSATDLDGDSIVYEMCAPFLGAAHSSVGNPMPQPPQLPINQSIAWVVPYNASDMLGGVPLLIDSHTGLLTAIPNTIGQFVVGICMKEYRDGVLLSETTRDFQFNVAECGGIVASFYTPSFQCDDFSVQFANGSQFAQSYFWDFGDDLTDADTSILVDPTYTYPDTGTYVITLISEKNENCIDTISKAISLYNNTMNIDVDWDVLSCEDSLDVQIIDLSTDSINAITAWSWTLTNGDTTLSSMLSQPFFTIPVNDAIVLHGAWTASTGCISEFSFDFPYITLENFHDSTLFVCKNIDVLLNSDYPDDVSFVWSPEEGLNNPFLPNPTIYNIQSDASYFVTIQGGDSVCTNTFQVDIFVFENKVFAQANPDTILLGESSQLSATGPDSNSYHWVPSTNLASSTSQNTIATPLETTTYTVLSSNGCIDSSEARIVVINPECSFPNIFVPSGFTPNGDNLNDEFRVKGYLVSSMHLMVYNRWGELVFESTDPSQGWDGRLNGTELPPDVYGYYLTVGCINGASYETKGNVTLIR